ncbi:hypothetical protein NIES593_17780 [Hydrococcus rivularis NIES-593]|uniref:Uncharacterized protein n=1 Tax=Hydrococcus rivularis NIES-593 TaxID=1921803 RepID=A0A1U7HAX0_9CYAN|nr:MULTISPECIES: hypothetical protein [Cyanophyceae]MBE9003967.1 hypothetical protein [Fortiea sp. LEGE XX443]OKH20704.1 hypothetical protein NIES593_17780 [Hydrococcus rivularis NIES-593]
METIYIVGTVVVGIIVLVFLLRDRLSELFIRASSQGEAELKVTAAKRKPQKLITQNPYSVDISGNNLIGKNKVAVKRDQTKITGNTAFGENQIEVSLPEQAASTSSPTRSEHTSNLQPPQNYLPETSKKPLEAELITEIQVEPEQQ